MLQMLHTGDALSLEDAQTRILHDIPALCAETQPLHNACGRVCAEDLRANLALPPFNNASMDGYAVQACDTLAAPIYLHCVGVGAAGSVSTTPLKKGMAQRIFTGAPLPRGADAVVMQESVESSTAGLLIRHGVEVGENVRQAGHDIAAGALLWQAGQRLGPAEVSVLASLGHSAVAVTRSPRVGIVCMGNELVDPGQPLAPGQIYNSNGPLLAAQVRESGGTVAICATVGDDFAALAAMLTRAVATCDLVLTSGGVSVGDYDWLRPVLAALGRVHFWRVAIKPGRPLTYGQINSTPVIGLPGNPASSFVCFELFARPALRRLGGVRQPRRAWRQAKLHTHVEAGPRRHLMRVHLAAQSDGLWATPLAKQGSGQQSSLCRVDGLLDVPAQRGPVLAQTRCPVLVLNPDV